MNISYYIIKDIENILFIDYLEAYNYCYKNKININMIIKTKIY